MPVRIRLQRHGKKGKPFYWIVAADGRSKRDGKFLEKLGTYNPNTNPAQITLNIDDSVTWLQNGAQPSETAKRILSYKGVLLKHHLLGGVRKGALTEEQAEEKFNAWVAEKEKAVAKKEATLDKAQEAAKAKALEAEKEINEKRIQAAAEAAMPEEATEVEDSEIVITEAAAEEAVVEEAPAAEAKEEAPVAEEAKEEAPAAEEVKEEAPAAEAKDEAPAAEKTEAKEDATPSEKK
ncbi:MAG: 30S ribosomal protein S16 [Eudoraea sp.]|nr:30S ribosomal protein S16 [Eudoraea sp.]